MTKLPKFLRFRILLWLGIWFQGGLRTSLEIDEGFLEEHEKNGKSDLLSANRTILSLVSYVATISALAWTCISYTWDLDGGSENWFQRSGAILVLSAIAMEMLHYVRGGRGNFGSTELCQKLASFAKWSGYVFAGIGTIIWAYGDWFV